MSKIQCCFKRYEKKYLLNKDQYMAMVNGMAAYMKPDEHPNYSISNIYFDTKNYDLIRNSLEKPVYKEKLRMRSYGVPGNMDTVFVEIKKKYDGVVYKRRVTMKMIEALRYLDGNGRRNDSQIHREIDYFLKLYNPKPKVFIAYDREAYAAADGGELRITFDTNLRARENDVDLRSGDQGAPLLPDDVILMEIKIPGTAPMWLSRLLSENKVFPTTFSKYGEYYKQYVLAGEPAIALKEVVYSA